MKNIKILFLISSFILINAVKASKFECEPGSIAGTYYILDLKYSPKDGGYFSSVDLREMFYFDRGNKERRLLANGDGKIKLRYMPKDNTLTLVQVVSLNADSNKMAAWSLNLQRDGYYYLTIGNTQEAKCELIRQQGELILLKDAEYNKIVDNTNNQPHNVFVFGTGY